MPFFVFLHTKSCVRLQWDDSACNLIFCIWSNSYASRSSLRFDINLFEQRLIAEIEGTRRIGVQCLESRKSRDIVHVVNVGDVVDVGAQ